MKRFIFALAVLFAVSSVGIVRAQLYYPDGTQQFACNKSLPINVSATGTAQLIPAVAGAKIVICSFDFQAAGATIVTFEHGTGSLCGTGTTPDTGPYNEAAQTGVSASGGNAPVIVVPAGNAWCINNSAAIQVSGVVTYAQY